VTRGLGSVSAYDLLALPVRQVEPRSSRLDEMFSGRELRAIASEAFAVQERGVGVWSGLAGAVATAGPVAIGVATGNRGTGLIAGIGGLNTALCVPRAAWRSRLWWGTIGAVGGCCAVVLATLATRHTWLLACVTFAWVGSWALLRAAGSAGALVGFAVGAVLVVIAGLPPGEPALGSRELWFAVGAAASLALMVVALRGPATSGPVARAAVTAVRTGASRDDALRAHALRLAFAVALATVVERALRMPHGYWVPLTVLAIVQPAARATEVRSLQRAAGTLVGVAVIVAVTALTGEVWVLVVCTAITSLGLFALDERGYFWLVVMLTPAALMMLSIADFQGFEVGVERTLNSAVGIVFGLVIGETAWRISDPSASSGVPSESD
jgi:Fusaric acid resistance protein-like